jgi:hypothetical protein
VPAQKRVGILISDSGREAASINMYKEISDLAGGAHSHTWGSLGSVPQDLESCQVLSLRNTSESPESCPQSEHARCVVSGPVAGALPSDGSSSSFIARLGQYGRSLETNMYVSHWKFPLLA